MATRYNYTGGIVTNGLVLNLDAAKVDSYPGTGTTWNDISGNNNSVTLTNGPTFSGIGKQASIVFDGVDDTVNMGTSSIFQPSSTGTGFYVEPVSPNFSNSTLIVCNSYPNYLRLDVDGNTTFTLNTPVYFCFTLSGGVGAMYVNGVSKTITTQGTPTISNTSDTKYIMSNSPSYATYTPGAVYSTQIYNRALSAAEVSQNFNALRGRYGI